MRFPVVFLSIVLVGLVVGCSKSNAKGGGGTNDSTSGGGPSGGGTGTKGGLSFAGFEYQGYMTELSREWQKPILVHFNADSTVIDYCFFYLTTFNGPFTQDSVVGKILQVGTASGGGPSVTVYFKDLADTQVYNFSPDLSGLTGGSNGLAENQFYFQGLTKDTKVAAPIGTSFWTCDSSMENNSTKGLPWYPDINGMQFYIGDTLQYFRNGGPVQSGIVPNQYTVTSRYSQQGNRVYFYGFNEVYFVSVFYWGIISDDGNTINADTDDFTNGRVPTYVQTFDYYGEPGNPPVMHRRLN